MKEKNLAPSPGLRIVTCPECEEKFSSSARRRTKCPKCGKHFRPWGV